MKKLIKYLLILFIFALLFWGCKKLLYNYKYEKILSRAYNAFLNQDTHSAREMAQNAAALSPEKEKAYIDLYYIAFAERDYEAALETANQMAQKTADPAAYIMQAKAYLYLDMANSAAQSLEKTENIKFKEPSLYLEAASINCGLGENEKALADIEKYEHYNGESFVSLFMKAVNFQRLGRKDEMKAALAQAEVYSEEDPLIIHYTAMFRGRDAMDLENPFLRAVEEKVGNGAKNFKLANEALVKARELDPVLNLGDNFPVCGKQEILHKKYSYNLKN